MQQSALASDHHWYQSVIAQLGAGGVFALAIIWVVLRFIRNKRNGDGISVMDYLKTAIEPRFQDLRDDHKSLMAKVDDLPTRTEMRANIKGHIKDHEREFHEE